VAKISKIIPLFLALAASPSFSLYALIDPKCRVPQAGVAVLQKKAID